MKWMQIRNLKVKTDDIVTKELHYNVHCAFCAYELDMMHILIVNHCNMSVDEGNCLKKEVNWKEDEKA